MFIFKRKALKGFTLLEVMLSLSFNALIILALVSLYYSVSNTYVFVKEVADELENMRFASYFFHNINDCSKKIIGLTTRDLRRKKLDIKTNTDAIAFKHSNVTSVIYVADTHRLNKNGEKIFSLYCKNDKSPRDEIIIGVNNLITEFEMGCQYVRADEVRNWDNVKRIKITLQLATTRNSLPGTFKIYLTIHHEM